ncbi:DEAD/DEAH box helicase [Muricoccus radiodurans]|uniref:DEAD/DEAH box helicase n=1 Tax=Muricoccus radiodurans TaxID=2231721 RepID=UPI003CE8C6A9
MRDILAAVTPGGGKSLLPVIAARALITSGLCERVCWVVPRDSLRLQAEEAFADPTWRAALGHSLSVRAAENAPGDPCRGLEGYVTTYQGIAAAPDLHLAAFRQHRYLLVVDEVHHLPALGQGDSAGGHEGRDGHGPDPSAAWSAAIEPLLACASARLLLSGTLERADGRRILWLPYRAGGGGGGRQEVDLAAPGWAVVGYSRARALAERAVLPVAFGALDGEAAWLGPEPEEGGPRPHLGPHRLRAVAPNETTRPALFTALRTGFAEALLRRSFEAARRLRAERRGRLEVGEGRAIRGLGKLLVVAPDQGQARRYLDILRRWVPAAQQHTVALAVSDERGAHETLAAFRLTPEPSVAEHRLRQRLAEMVAAQAMEDAQGGRGGDLSRSRARRAPRGGAVPRLQRRPQAVAGRAFPGGDVDRGARGGAGVAGAEPPAGPPAPAGRRPPLRLGRPQARRVEVTGGKASPPLERPDQGGRSALLC